METNETSLHEIKVYAALSSDPTAWLSSAQVAERTGIAPRTARHHLLKLSRLGVVDCAEVFPGHKYQVAKKASKRNSGYVQRLEKAREVFGL